MGLVLTNIFLLELFEIMLWSQKYFQNNQAFLAAAGINGLKEMSSVRCM